MLIHEGVPSTLFSKSFEKERVFLGYEQIRKKIKLFDEKNLSMTSIKIRSGEKDLYCCIAPIAFNQAVSGFFLLQRDIPFDQEERNMITLCTDFMDLMLERLIAQKELERQYALYRSEISKVRTIQVSFLPDFKRINGYDVASIFLPAEDISGDFFDGYFLDDEVYQFVLCDVSGHGVASSDIGNESRSLCRTFSLRKFSPAVLIGAVNGIVSRDISGLYYFGTVIVCQLNIRTGEVLFSSGGHPPAVFCRSGESTCTLLNKTGPLVGFFEKGDFKDTGFVMKSGDALLLYTDGVPETFSSDGKSFTVRTDWWRFFSEARGSRPGISPDDREFGQRVQRLRDAGGRYYHDLHQKELGCFLRKAERRKSSMIPSAVFLTSRMAP